MIYYTRNEDTWNAATHAVGIVVGLVAGALLLSLCKNGWAVLGVAIYIAGMLGSYIASTVYHAWPHTDTVGRERWRQADHSAIYWHIAGSYAPICLTVLRPEAAWGWGLLAFVMACAIVGTIVSVRGLREHSHVETVCFCLMGLSVLVAFPVLLRCVDTLVIVWLIVEGVSYIGGAVVYAFSHGRPYVHTIFHLLVLCGSLAYIMAVWHVLK